MKLTWSVSFEAILITSFLTSFASDEIWVNSFIPNEINIPTAIIQMARSVYFAIVPIDLRLVTNNFNPKISKKKKWIPKVNRNKIPWAQSGVSNPNGVLKWLINVFWGKEDENNATIDAIKIPNNDTDEKTTIIAPIAFAKAPKMELKTSPNLFPKDSAPDFTLFPNSS